MDRNREARRATIVGSNGFKRRRHRTNSLRGSPDEDVGVELQDSVRLRDRVKKDRDRERERDRERDRERERDRDLRERSSRSKRRRAERLMSNREDVGGDETSEESVNDDEDDEDEDNTTAAATSGGGVRLLPPVVGSISNHHHSHLSNHSSSLSQQQQNNSSNNNIISSNHHLQPRKSFPPSSSSSSKVFRAAPVWKPGDEMIGVSVPRKARSACTKRSHDWISSSSNNNSAGGVAGGELILRQASSSPVRQGPVSTSTPSPAAPMSPSSSNASIRKKLKLNSGSHSGPKVKPLKVSSKTSSSNPEELEIEIAEVLYGLRTQSQGPSLKKEDSREANRSSSDAKSLVSSPISNSASANNLILAPTSSPLSAVAPKRKRPRQVLENPSYCARGSPVFGKQEMNQIPKSEISSPKLEKISGSTAENGYEIGGDSVNSQGPHVQLMDLKAPESMKVDSEFKSTAEELKESIDLVAHEEVSSTRGKESSLVRTEDSSRLESTLTVTVTASAAVTMIKACSMGPEVENQREEKFVIDLMAPPPQVRSSPERETKIDLCAAAEDQKPVLSIVDSQELKSAVLKDKEVEKGGSGKDHSIIVAAEEKKGKTTAEGAESQKSFENKARNIDLQFDLEKSERDGIAGVNATGTKLQQQAQKQQQQQMHLKVAKEEPHTGKSGQSTSSLPLPMSMASWPGGLPPMGYMAPLQGVVSLDGSTVTPAPIQPLFSQPRPKRCATHCYIARNINYLQQFMKMNSFWPAPAGSASLFGSKPSNLHPAADLHGNNAVRGVNNVQDKGQNVASISGHGGKEQGSQPASTADSGQRKQQIILQQSLPSVPSSNILGPAFIFPLNQQQAAVAATSARPSATKSHTATGQASSTTSNSATASASATAGIAASAMSFNYPNMAANETQYLAILQNNAYPFPIPAVGAPPNYRGTPAQPMPLFNGSFYSSQMIHPSQLQHQHTPASQSPQLQQTHQNANTSSASSATQKHLQSQQQRVQSSGASGATGSPNMQNFPTQKSQPSQQLQQAHSQHVQHPARRHLENEVGSDESPSTTDGRGGSWASVNIYGQNFAMPIHPQNFALMTPAALASSAAAAAAVSGTSNQSEKKQQQPQQQVLKTGADSLPPHSFAMSFGPINGTTPGPGIDITSMAQNHAIFQSFPEATRQNIQMMAAAASASQVTKKNNFRISEDGKSGGGDSSATDDERKNLAGKGQGGVGQSIAFTRCDLVDTPVSSIPANSVIESSARSLNVATGPARSSRPVTTNAAAAINVPNAHIHAQLQQQQILQIKQQQQLAATAGNRSKAPVTSNGSIYSDHLNQSSMVAKFPNPLSGFPQNIVQNNSSSTAQSPQWKGSTRTATSQAPSTLASSTVSTLKSLPQQHSRSQPQMHTQISFGGNQKSSTSSQGQAPPSSNQVPSPPIMVGSPTTSSISKGSSGSPRTTTPVSTNNKIGQASSLSAQQAKHSSSIPSQKSPSILGNPHISSSSSGPKPHMQQLSQQQQQQQIPKTMQQAQLFFSNPYSQVPSPHSTCTSSTTSGPSGYYMQRRRTDQHHQPTQQLPGAPSTTSTGLLSLCPPVTLSSTSTNDPAKAIAAATCNVKGGGLPSQGIIHAAQLAAQSAGTLLPAGFSYPHPVPAAVQAKPSEQKQSAGNDNLQPWQSEKK